VARQSKNIKKLYSSADDWQELCTLIKRECISCGLCRKDCLYLQTFGLPDEQAEEALAQRLNFSQFFSCSLCGLCAAVCPRDIDPSMMFSSLRREAVSRNQGTFKEHNSLTGYEKCSGSETFTWYGLPRGCETVFFPGCALPGTRPKRVQQVIDVLRQHIPALGVVLDCCTKPSHDLGRIDYFSRSFAKLRNTLVESGVRRVLVACPNCFRMFDQYGDGLQVQTIYEVLTEHDFKVDALSDEVTVHDPCGVRNQPRIHEAVRKLVSSTGLSMVEMKHQGKRTVCCGEGGAVSYLNSEFADNWTNIRAEEAAGKRIITYCAGCTSYLNRLTPTSHILDLLFEGTKTLQGTVRVAQSPFTWINRLMLKQKIKKQIE
jgi:Fe-S oxidoreductase